MLLNSIIAVFLFAVAAFAQQEDPNSHHGTSDSRIDTAPPSQPPAAAGGDATQAPAPAPAQNTPPSQGQWLQPEQYPEDMDEMDAAGLGFGGFGKKGFGGWGGGFKKGGFGGGWGGGFDKKGFW